jgi:hypothetical protein
MMILPPTTSSSTDYSQEFTQLGLENTISHKLSLLGDLGGHLDEKYVFRKGGKSRGVEGVDRFQLIKACGEAVREVWIGQIKGWRNALGTLRSPPLVSLSLALQ